MLVASIRTKSFEQIVPQLASLLHRQAPSHTLLVDMHVATSALVYRDQETAAHGKRLAHWLPDCHSRRVLNMMEFTLV
jgi:hypothetical protein